MASQSLVLCRDPEVLGILQPLLAQMGIGASVCSAPPAAEALLGLRKFDPVIVDCDAIEGAPELLQSVRQVAPNVESIALAIVTGFDGMQRAFRLGANLVMWKPVNPEEASRVLRTARGLVSRMRRRFSRLVVHSLAYVKIEGLPDDAMIADISQGGMGIQALDPLQAGRTVQLRFTLPGSAAEIAAAGEVMWADDAGRAGLRFAALPETAQATIQDWIAAQMAQAAAHWTSPQPPVVPEQPRYHPPLQVTDSARKVLAFALDALLVGAATALFGFVFYLVTLAMPDTLVSAAAGVALFALLGLAYRRIFFPDAAQTPGAHAGQLLCEAYLEFQEHRRVQVAGSP
jgi:CheY-like chemotaxis protein